MVAGGSCGVAAGTNEMVAAGGGEGAERTYARPLPFFPQAHGQKQKRLQLAVFFFLLSDAEGSSLSLSRSIITRWSVVVA